MGEPALKLREDLRPFTWKPGQSGNPAGRPKGARAKLEQAFLDDLLADWEKNGAMAIEACRDKDVVAYVKIVGATLPKRIDAEDGEPGSRAKLKRIIEVIESAILDGDAGSPA